MKKTNIGWYLVLAVVMVSFFFGLSEVLRLRTDLSGAFPEYSSYRADPMGTEALYKALSRVPELKVERNERDVSLFRGGDDTALFLLGVYESPDPFKLILHLEEFVSAGGRLVLTYAMRGRSNDDCLNESEAESLRGENESAEDRIRGWIKREEVPAVKPSEPRERWEHGDQILASERWGFRVVAPMNADDFKKQGPLLAKGDPAVAFAEPVPWKGPEYLLPLRGEWETIYTAGDDDRPVLMRRPFGKGDIIVASDSYFLSNKAMRADRRPALLAWMIGDKERVVFEESSKGVDRSPGVVALMKKYHLHIAMGMAALLALLYVWRGTVPLLPRRTETQERDRAVLLRGRDAHAGLAALLRRAAPPEKVLQVCFDEWMQAFDRAKLAEPSAVNQARQITHAELDQFARNRGEEITQRYREAAALLRERRTKP